MSSSLIASAEPLLDTYQSRREANPDKDYSNFASQIADLLKEAGETLRGSTIPADQSVWKSTREMTERLGELRATNQVTPKAEHDSKDHIKREAGMPQVKRKAISIPHFSGRLSEWHPFWNRFRELVHDATDLTYVSKLAYLRDSIDDPEIQDMLDTSTEGEDFYQNIVKTLLRKYDKPRTLHEDICRSIADLKPIKANRTSLESLATTISHALAGLKRLGQSDFTYVATSLAMAALPLEIRSSWEDKTVKSRQVPSGEELVEFLRDKAGSAMYKDTAVSNKHAERKTGKQSSHRQKGSVHTTTTQPAAVEPAPSSSYSSNSIPQSRQRSKAAPKTAKPATNTCKYQCKLCNANHYVFFCSQFLDMTVPQRKEHLSSNSLCHNCLKPGHSFLTADQTTDAGCVRATITV